MNRIIMITEFGHIFIKVFFAWNLRRFAQLNKIVSSLLIEYARCNYNAELHNTKVTEFKTQNDETFNRSF